MRGIVQTRASITCSRCRRGACFTTCAAVATGQVYRASGAGEAVGFSWALLMACGASPSSLSSTDFRAYHVTPWVSKPVLYAVEALSF